MATPLPVGSASLLAQLARPTPAYRIRVWLAVTSLALFLVLYLLLALWFLSTAWRLTFGAAAGEFVGYLVGGCAFFLAVFMLKAIFFVKRGDIEGLLEVTAKDEPRLFEFLHALAAEARAPRPHRVFLSPRVNAGVFYDLTPINLILPTRKNLEIGLPLVNTLTMGEFRAVLAHEFGHFSQRSMALLRWSYIAQQIAGHLVARRDALDSLLNALSNFDYRIAWVGWILSLIVWSIRSLVDSAFSIVVRLQRALSREMEFQADLVAVALTGSDALIHALHRLRAGDECWDRTIAFLNRLLAREHYARDAFAIHARYIERIGGMVGDPGFAQVPPVPADHPESHRVFTPEFARPPEMWATHPPNQDREANAKRSYVLAERDDCSAWVVFDDPEGLRAKLSAMMMKSDGKPLAPAEASLEEQTRDLERESVDPRYHGLYLTRSIARGAATPAELIGPSRLEWRSSIDQLYPASLSADVRRQRTLERELAQLRALSSDVATPSNERFHHRGQPIRLRDLPAVIAQVERETWEVDGRLRAVDLTCRSVHLAAAAEVGNGWPEYMRGTLAVLHYADHTLANLQDVAGLLSRAIHVTRLARRAGADGWQRVIEVAQELYMALCAVHTVGASLQLDARLLARLGAATWKDALGDFKLPSPVAANLGSWLNVINSWIGPPAAALGTLRTAALDELLRAERYVAECARRGDPAEPAPTPTKVPAPYVVLLPGAERRLNDKLSPWEQFRAAQGVAPALARFAVAAGIVVTVLGFSASLQTGSVVIYNGLGIPVVVRVGDVERAVPAFARHLVQLRPGTYRVQTQAADGREIESFPVEIPGSFAKFAYNVGGASPLVEWTATYGSVYGRHPARYLGAPRWSQTSADAVFEAPPTTMSTTAGSGTTQLVLSGFADSSPALQVRLADSREARLKIIRAHARWDPAHTASGALWLKAAERSLPDVRQLLQARLAEAPNDVVLLRSEEDVARAAGDSSVCMRYAGPAKSGLDEADAAYLSARCLADPAATRAAFIAGHRRWPRNDWLAFAAGKSYSEVSDWRSALPALDQARRELAPVAEAAALDEARILRMLGEDTAKRIAQLTASSDRLRDLLAAENGTLPEHHELQAYAALARGELAGALHLAAADSEGEVRMVRMVGASDGSTAEQQSRALALGQTTEMDFYSTWYSMALAMRYGRGGMARQATDGESKRVFGSMMAFLANVHRGGDFAAAERALIGLPVESQGAAYAMGVIILGPSAPPAWRHRATRLLFVVERPYFK